MNISIRSKYLFIIHTFQELAVLREPQQSVASNVNKQSQGRQQHQTNQDYQLEDDYKLF